MQERLSVVIGAVFCCKFVVKSVSVLVISLTNQHFSATSLYIARADEHDGFHSSQTPLNRGFPLKYNDFFISSYPVLLA